MEPFSLAITLFVLLVLSGAFSGAETALFSIPPLRLREMQTSTSPSERRVARLMAHPRRTLVTILIGNLAVNTLASALGADAAIRATGNVGWGVLLATFAMTFIVLVATEVAPKTLAYRHSEATAKTMARPFLVLSHMLTPFQWPLLRLTDLLLGGDSRPDERTDLAEVDAMLHVAHSEGQVDRHERDLVGGVIELGSSPLGDVMTPRTEIFSLRPDVELETARRLVRDAGFSKVPISSGDPDEMLGVVTALDLLLAPEGAPVAGLAHKAEYVPEVKPALELLEEFQKSGQRIAFVIDEHGHLSGLVTLTDLLEEISGEMIERADLHKVAYRRIGRDRVIVPARMEIRYFNEEFGTELEAEESETIGGLLLERTGRIPAAGETLEVGPVRFRVLEAEPSRLMSIEAVLGPRSETPRAEELRS
jgi:CBS domain containing-hemolysin-like protein